MGLFSFFSKNKQEPATGDSDFYSRSEEQPATRSRAKRKQGNAPVDPVLPEKKRARRRLVGAIALVLAVVIGLPMVLDSEPKPLADDIAIQIPSKDKPQPAPRPVTKPAASAPVETATTLSRNEEVIEPAPPAREKPVTEPVKPPVAEKPVEKPAEKPAATVKPNDSARALAILENKAQVKPEAKADAAKTTGKFVIQVAALASQDKVNELQGKLKDAGIKTYTQKVATESGERIRIRVGPFSNKEEADRTIAKLTKLGLNGKLVPA